MLQGVRYGDEISSTKADRWRLQKQGRNASWDHSLSDNQSVCQIQKYTIQKIHQYKNTQIRVFGDVGVLMVQRAEKIRLSKWEELPLLPVTSLHLFLSLFSYFLYSLLQWYRSNWGHFKKPSATKTAHIKPHWHPCLLTLSKFFWATLYNVYLI